MEALVNKIIPFSSVDGPGNRTAIFLQGCNFDCRYCHYPETIHLCIGCGSCLAHCPTGAIFQKDGQIAYDAAKCVFCDVCFKHCPHGSSPRVRRMSADQVMEEVRKNCPFIRGITVSGGECTRWPGFLTELLGKAQAEGLDTLLDSNGSYDFEQDPALLAVTGGVMLDVKAWDETQHIRLTGQSNAMVKKNLLFLDKHGKLEEVRTVVAPDQFDAEQTVRETCRLLAPWLSKRPVRYKIICYRPMGVRAEALETLQVPSVEFLTKLRVLALGEGFSDVVII